MKKKINAFVVIMVSALALASPFYSVAQSKDKVWSIGPEVGVNLSKYGRDMDESNFKPGLLTGGFVTYSIRNTYGFTGKVLFSQKGYQLNDYKETITYVEIPVVARLFFNREGKFRPNIFGGTSFGFLTGAKSKTGTNDTEQIDNYKNVYNTFDFGLTGGLGLNFEIARETRFLIDARYTHGLTDITKTTGSDVNNNAIGITAGFSFGI
jgi:hypothetical protein